MTTNLVERLAFRYSKLDSDRITLISDMQEICEFLQPERAKFYGGITRSTSSQRQRIFDSTPEDSHQILAAGLHSLMTPAAQTWINLSLAFGSEDSSSEEKQWIDEVIKLMMAKFNSEESGFHSAVHEFYLDLPGLGTAMFFVDEINDKIRFQCIPLSEIRISENYMGLIDTVFREFTLSARQIVENKKWDHPYCVTQSMEQDPDKRFTVIHAIEPREKWNRESVRGKDMEFLSCYFILDSKELLFESGYQEMPAMVPRWSKTSGEVYGRGLGHRGLPDFRVLNEMNRSMLIAGERAADPVTFLPHDGFVGDVSSDGGAMNYYRGTGDIRERVMTIGSEADLNALGNMITIRQSAIRKMFMNDQLQPFDKVQMTATEYVGNQNEKMRVLGPVLGRLQTEFLGPLVKRVFNIMLRNGELPPPPEEMQGQEMRIQYISPISRAQKQTEAEAFTQAINYLAPVVQIAPGIIQNFDFDAVARDTQDMFGFPTKYLKSPETMKKERQAAEAAQAKQAQMMEASQALALKGQAKEVNSEPE